jgi:RNA polymerase sigma factor (sigma-70 family)
MGVGTMIDQENTGVVISDEELILQARAGDRGAFAELWLRHARSGLRVARQFTSSVDADDLVAEAYTRIYQKVLSGGGPDGGFRPYLYTTIRNLASRWGQSNKDVQVDDLAEFEDPAFSDDSVLVALDRTLTVRAFRTLPERWQSVLWYTEVEGMDPHEVAPILGMSANGVAALAYRAREGLRKAWLQAHISDATAQGDCRWAITRLGDYARRGLTDRERTRVELHLRGCAKCSIIAEEVDEVGSRLALVMIPIVLGAGAGGAVLATLSAPSSATAAQLLTPAIPPAFHVAASVAAPAVMAGLGFSVPTALVSGLAVAVALSGGLAVNAAVQEPALQQQVAVGEHPQTAADPVAQAIAQSQASGPGSDSGNPDPGDPGDLGGQGGSADGTPGGIGHEIGGVVGGAAGTVNGVTDGVGSLVQGITAPLDGVISSLPLHPGAVPDYTAPGGILGADAALDLSGTGMPGATVSAQAAGVVYGTAVVTPQGTWAIHVSALPQGIGPISLKQNLTLLGVTVPLDIPLSLLSRTLGVTIDLLN